MSDVNMKNLLSICLILMAVPRCFADKSVKTTFLYHRSSKTGINYTMGHIAATGPVDSLHYIISTIGFPTVLVAHTKPHTSLTVDWDRFLSGNSSEMADSIQLTPSSNILYSYAVMFSKLLEYNDTQDYSDMSKYGPQSTAWNVYNLNDFSWEEMSSVSQIKQNVVLLKAAKDSTALWKNNGTFSIKLQAFGQSGREDQLPHLQYSDSIMQFDLTIDQLWSNLSKSRFAVEAIMIGQGTQSMKIDKTRSIDDEYTPGVFSINNWMTLPDDQSKTGFLQWKPVCYQALARARDKATFVRNYGLVPVDDKDKMMVGRTITYGFYGYEMMKYTMAASNFSFGLTEDGGYNKTGVLTWSGSIGYGSPPYDQVSTIVIIIIAAGLGLPGVLIIIGGIYVCVKKRNKDRPQNPESNGYQPIKT